jgi:hypothetical protein
MIVFAPERNDMKRLVKGPSDNEGSKAIYRSGVVEAFMALRYQPDGKEKLKKWLEGAHNKLTRLSNLFSTITHQGDLEDVAVSIKHVLDAIRHVEAFTEPHPLWDEIIPHATFADAEMRGMESSRVEEVPDNLEEIVSIS